MRWYIRNSYYYSIHLTLPRYLLVVVLPVYKTRLSVIWGVLRPPRLLVIASYALLGGGASYCLAELAGYHYLWSPHQRYVTRNREKFRVTISLFGAPNAAVGTV